MATEEINDLDTVEQVAEAAAEAPTDKLTPEETAAYAEKAEAIQKSLLGVSKVHVVVQIVPDTYERKVCYLREPNYMTKIAVMDKAVSIGVYFAAEELREQCVIKEESDAITYGDSAECDRFKMGVVDYCLGMIGRLQNQFKKK